MLQTYFHKCNDAEQCAGEYALSEHLQRIPNNYDYLKCTKRQVVNNPTSYWFFYDHKCIGLFNLKMLNDNPLMLAVTFTPLANLN